MKKSTSQTKQTDSDTEEYTQEEIEKLDYYHNLTNHVLDDDDIYDLMCKYGDDESKIREKLYELTKEANKGDEYQWHEVGKKKEKKVNKPIFKKNNFGYQKNIKDENERENKIKGDNTYNNNNNNYYRPYKRNYYKNNNYYKKNYRNYKSKDAIEVPDINDNKVETKVVEKEIDNFEDNKINTNNINDQEKEINQNEEKENEIEIKENKKSKKKHKIEIENKKDDFEDENDKKEKIKQKKREKENHTIVEKKEVKNQNETELENIEEISKKIKEYTPVQESNITIHEKERKKNKEFEINKNTTVSISGEEKKTQNIQTQTQNIQNQNIQNSQNTNSNNMNNPNQRLMYPFPVFYNPNMKMPINQNDPKQPIYCMMVPYFMMCDPNSNEMKDKNNNMNYPYYPQYIPPQNFQVPEQGQDYPFNQIQYGIPMMQMYPMNPNFNMNMNMDKKK